MSIVKGTKEFDKTPTVNGADVLTTGNVLDDLSNVNVAAPATGDRLEWNGSAWVPAALATAAEFDTQSAGSGTQTSTTSGTWVDIPDLTITTSNTQALDYMIFAHITVKGSVAPAILSIRLLADGVEVVNSLQEIEVFSQNTIRKLPISTNGLVNLVNAKVIKAQYKTTLGTFTVYGRNLMVRGAK